MKLYFKIVSFVLTICVLACNNPFQTRDPQVPPPGGAAIRPANSAENVLYNIRVAFDSLSVQDYLDTFADDFVFIADPEDYAEYETQFGTHWGKEKEREFANNLFLSVQSARIAIFNYEYMPGQEMYEYDYVIEIKDVNSEQSVYRGRAWLYLEEYADGKWYIYRWEDHRVQHTTNPWGVLRALYI